VFAVSPNTTDIGSITVYGSSSETPTLYVGYYLGTPDPSAFAPITQAGGRNLGGLAYSNPKLRVKGFIQGTLTGLLEAHEILRFDFGTASSPGTGTIAANISHNPSADPTVAQLGGLFAKRVAPGAVIASYNSNIRVLQTFYDFEGSVQTTGGKDLQSMVVGRDFKGLISSSGSIANLQILRNGTGSISAASNLGSGTISGHWGAHPVGLMPNYQSSSISVGGSISTSLTVGGDYIGELSANDALSVSIGGGFCDHVGGSNAVGLISIAESIDQLSVGEPTLGTATGIMVDLDASTVTNEVILSGDFTSGSALLRDGLPLGSVFQIGQSLATGVVIEFEKNPLDANDVGLQGQVVINQDAGSGTWNGTVQVNDGSAITAVTPNYTTLSKDIGNGAAGAAPFNFHQFAGPMPASPADLDCNPWHTQTVAVGNCEGDLDTLCKVVIDHYGPVFVTGTGDFYRIEFRPDYFPSSWADVTDQFEVDIIQTATADGGSNREVVIRPISTNTVGFDASGYFRFRPLEGKVKCANVFGVPDVAYDSSIVSGDLGNTSSGTQYDWYQFRVRLRVCREEEMFIFENEQVNAADIAAWIDEPFEVNMDGQICEQDLADMLTAYDAQ
jgi:hypothetical protein